MIMNDTSAKYETAINAMMSDEEVVDRLKNISIQNEQKMMEYLNLLKKAKEEVCTDNLHQLLTNTSDNQNKVCEYKVAELKEHLEGVIQARLNETRSNQNHNGIIMDWNFAICLAYLIMCLVSLVVAMLVLFMGCRVVIDCYPILIRYWQERKRRAEYIERSHSLMTGNRTLKSPLDQKQDEQVARYKRQKSANVIQQAWKCKIARKNALSK